MITVDGYNLSYNTEHLLSSKPKTYKEILERLDKLECKLFYNIISSPDCYYEQKFADGRIQEHYKVMNAQDRFKNIFVEKKLYANPKSYFVNKLNVTATECEEIKSVSFTFCDYTELHHHFERRGSEFGICFFHDFLQNKGMRPVEYLSEIDDYAQKRLVFNSPHLVEVYTKRYDMRWENEWRINYNLEFTEDDIAFVIVPRNRHKYFVEWFSDQEDFQNIQILASDAYTSPVDYLIGLPQQDDNSWRQVKVCGTEDMKGYPIDPDFYNDLSTDNKTSFLEGNRRELSCLIKNTILSKYEGAYTHKFLRFRNQIKDVTAISILFDEYVTIAENVEEPEDSERDLVIGLFGDLWQAYPDFDIDDL